MTIIKLFSPSNRLVGHHVLPPGASLPDIYEKFGLLYVRPTPERQVSLHLESDVIPYVQATLVEWRFR